LVALHYSITNFPRGIRKPKKYIVVKSDYVVLKPVNSGFAFFVVSELYIFQFSEFVGRLLIVTDLFLFGEMTVRAIIK